MERRRVEWPALRQLRGDRTGRGPAVRSERTLQLQPRTKGTDVVKSVCPYCAVGCGQDVYVRDGEVIQIEGDDDSPISRGRLCPKGSATLQLTTGPERRHQVLYRRPRATDWVAGTGRRGAEADARSLADDLLFSQDMPETAVPVV